MRDVTMTIAGLRRYGDWRHVATGCNAVVHAVNISETKQDSDSYNEALIGSHM